MANLTTNVIDDVEWPWKVKVVTPIRLVEPSISKTAWDRRSVPMKHQ